MNRLLAFTGAAIACAPAVAATFTGSYTQNFNGMGTGTAAPADWRITLANFGNNDTWKNANGIIANGANSVASLPGTTSQTLIATTSFTSSTRSSTQGYNFATAANNTDRALGVSPTTIAGGALQLLLTNNTGFNRNDITLSFDTRRFTAVSTANELPGYWLFYSLDNGTSWTNVAALNPTLATVPNTAGVTSVTNALVTFNASWNNGSNLLLRWVDDNADETSPDQVIGLDNVIVTPAPGAVVLAGMGAIFAGRRRRN